MSRLIVAFELQFVRFIDELCKLYPREGQLHTWRIALQLKQTLLPQETRRLVFTHFRDKVSIPYGTYIERDDEVGLIQSLQHVQLADEEEAGWFQRFHAMYINEADVSIKQIMWQYISSLHQLVCLAEPIQK